MGSSAPQELDSGTLSPTALACARMPSLSGEVPESCEIPPTPEDRCLIKTILSLAPPIRHLPYRLSLRLDSAIQNRSINNPPDNGSTYCGKRVSHRDRKSAKSGTSQSSTSWSRSSNEIQRHKIVAKRGAAFTIMVCIWREVSITRMGSWPVVGCWRIWTWQDYLH